MKTQLDHHRKKELRHTDTLFLKFPKYSPNKYSGTVSLLSHRAVVLILVPLLQQPMNSRIFPDLLGSHFRTVVCVVQSDYKRDTVNDSKLRRLAV
jgi:hypothetical protein